MELTLVKPGSEEHGKVAAIASCGVKINQTSLDINQIVEAFNASEVGGIIVVPVPELSCTAANMHNLLQHRGLVRDLDYSFDRLATDANGVKYKPSERPGRMFKLTEKEGKIVKPKRSGFHV